MEATLTGPLAKIAQWALSRVEGSATTELSFRFFDRLFKRWGGEVVPFLAECVEKLSDGKATVRPFSAKGVRLPEMGAYTYLCVVCPRETPEGTVSKITQGMFPFAVSNTPQGYHALSRYVKPTQ